MEFQGTATGVQKSEVDGKTHHNPTSGKAGVELAAPVMCTPLAPALLAASWHATVVDKLLAASVELHGLQLFLRTHGCRTVSQGASPAIRACGQERVAPLHGRTGVNPLHTIHPRPSLRFVAAWVRVTRMKSQGIHWAGKWHLLHHVTDAGA